MHKHLADTFGTSREGKLCVSCSTEGEGTPDSINQSRKVPSVSASPSTSSDEFCIEEKNKSDASLDSLAVMVDFVVRAIVEEKMSQLELLFMLQRMGLSVEQASEVVRLANEKKQQALSLANEEAKHNAVSRLSALDVIAKALLEADGVEREAQIINFVKGGASESDVEFILRKSGVSRLESERLFQIASVHLIVRDSKLATRSGLDDSGTNEIFMFVLGFILNFGGSMLASFLLGMVGIFADVLEKLISSAMGAGLTFVAQGSGSLGFFLGATLGFICSLLVIFSVI